MSIPMLNVLAVSLSTRANADSPGLVLFPHPITFEGYSFIWNNFNLKHPFYNTVFISVVGTLLHVFMASLAGFIIAKRDIPFRKQMTSFIMLTMAVPSELSMIGLYAVNRQLGLINTYAALIINGMITGFSVFIMRNYFLSIPISLEESARLDGASEFRVFCSIYMRLSTPAIVTIGTLEFIRRWNNISLVATLISDMDKWTLPVMLKMLLFDSNSTSGNIFIFGNAKMAAVVITALPLIVIYFLSQNSFVKGAKTGAIKG
jgi:putative aldouronate transport system permease protein